MAGEGKKREKFHTHRAGKLDQENLYTGAAHLYPPLNRSYPPPSDKTNISYKFGDNPTFFDVNPHLLIHFPPSEQSAEVST